MDPKTPWEYCNITKCGKGVCLLIRINSNCLAVVFAVCRQRLSPGANECLIAVLI